MKRASSVTLTVTKDPPLKKKKKSLVSDVRVRLELKLKCVGAAKKPNNNSTGKQVTYMGGRTRPISAKQQASSTLPPSPDIISETNSDIGTAGGPLPLHSSDGLRVALSKAHDHVLTIKKQIELKRRREQARLALIEIEKSVVLEDNLESMKELERLCGCQVGIGGIPLDWLGLRRKDDDDDDDIGTAGTLHSSDGLRVALSKARDVLAMRKQSDLKRRREQARLALIEIEKSLVLEDNLESMKELEGLCGCQVGIGGFPLDWLGLRRKIDDGEVDEEITNL